MAGERAQRHPSAILAVVAGYSQGVWLLYVHRPRRDRIVVVTVLPPPSLQFRANLEPVAPFRQRGGNGTDKVAPIESPALICDAVV